MAETTTLGTVPDGAGVTVRVSFNGNDVAVATDFLGATPPSPTYAGVRWRTSTQIRRRNDLNDAWIIEAELAKAAAPTAGDDINDGYERGSVWIDTSANKVWMCHGNTVGAAVWRTVEETYTSAEKSKLGGLSQAYLEPVIDRDRTAPPALPAIGDRHIVAASATGAWSGQSGKVAEWPGSAWQFTPPVEGALVYVKSEGKLYQSNGAGWTIVDTGGGGGSQIGDLTTENVFDATADFVGFRDTSAGADRKILAYRLGLPDVLTTPYQDRIYRVSAKDDDAGAKLRAILTAIGAASATLEYKITLDGPCTVGRDGSNAWCLQLPARNLVIEGRGESSVIKHAYTSDTSAWPILYTANHGGKNLTLERITLQGIWSNQSSKQEIVDARLLNARVGRILRLHGVLGYDGVEMGLTGQDWGLIEVDRCRIERNTRDCFNFNGRLVKITACHAAYSRDDCYASYCPSGVSDDENYEFGLLISDCSALQTNGIKANATRMTIANNTLWWPFLYGINAHFDFNGEGEVHPRDIIITGNKFFNIIANDQAHDVPGENINRAINITGTARKGERIVIRDNQFACTLTGAQWNGSTYGTPGTLKWALASADDTLGIYRKTGFTNAWEAPTTAAREPMWQRIAALLVTTQAPIDAAAYDIRGNTARNARQTETWGVAFVAHYNASGTGWAIPVAQAAWAAVTPQKHTLAGRHLDLHWDQVRLQVSVGATTFNGAVIKAQYTLDEAGATGWTDLCACTLTASTNTTIYPAYVAVPRDLLGKTVWLRLTGEAGNGSTSVSVIEATLQIVRNGDLAMPADTAAPVLAVSSAEKATPTSTSLRHFSPKDVADMLGTGGITSAANSQVVIAKVAYRDEATAIADTTLPADVVLEYRQSEYFKVIWVTGTLLENSNVAFDVPLREAVDPTKTVIWHASPKDRNGGPTGTFRYTSSGYGHVRFGFVNGGRTLRVTPNDRGEANAPTALFGCQIVEYIGPAGGSYEFEVLGVYDVVVSGVNQQKTTNFTQALASDAVRQKVSIHADTPDNSQANREQGPFGFVHSLTAFTLVAPPPNVASGPTYRCQVVHWKGAGWRVLKVYGGPLCAPSGTVTAISAYVVTGGTGFVNGETVTLSGATGTAATFTVTVSGGVVTALTRASAGSMTAVPANPASFTGGSGTGLTAFVHYTGGADTGDLLIRDKPPTAFANGTRQFTDDAGVATATLSAWSRALILPGGGWIGFGGAAPSNPNGYIASDFQPPVRPGTLADATNLSNVNFQFQAIHSISGLACCFYVLEDVIGGALGMRVTRYSATPASGATTDVDIDSAGILDSAETTLFTSVATSVTGSAPSGATGTPPSGGTGGHQAGYLLATPVKKSDGKWYARLVVPGEAYIADCHIQAACWPRGVSAS